MAPRPRLARLLERRVHLTRAPPPLAVGAHAAMESAFVILDFPDPAEDPSVVYLDSPSSAAYLQKGVEITRYETIFRLVCCQAVPILEYQP
ncbi:Scr1 family TA system antitoxin-like transcriptional regulator [Salinispora vitiensis]|uniref:Scr1 family TA system antitoxin-like transcriptional regulator n=1 Tax=Salinispora vitiensis TaxID=999544 RepID=UPI00295B4F2D|nr:Scr1 family TA system antitoxin-like transcriptional regulator [Salinispora vitiensis]